MFITLSSTQYCINKVRKFAVFSRNYKLVNNKWCVDRLLEYQYWFVGDYYSVLRLHMHFL